MKKTLITIVLATFLLSIPVSSEGREVTPSSVEIQAVSTPVTASTPSYLQSIGIGRRRTVRRRRRMFRRRMVRRSVVRHRRVIRRRAIRRRRVGIGLPIPRHVGVGVRRRRGY